MIPCCCISFFLTLFFVKGTSLKREDDEKLQEEGKQWAARHRTRDRLNFKGKKAEENGEVFSNPNRPMSSETNSAEMDATVKVESVMPQQ
jgi:hypothetical protein